MNDVVVFNGCKYRKDRKTGYYLCSKKVNGRRERLHRAVWMYHNGDIPQGFHVHHIDEDKTNNNITNLRLIASKKHESLHARNPEHIAMIIKNLPAAREKAKAWHKSADGRKWHSQIAQKQYEKMDMIKKTCEICGKEFDIKSIKQSNARFCSNACKSKWRRMEGLDVELKKCVYCGEEFSSNKYDRTETCSRSCAAKIRWSKRAGKN